MPQIAPRRIQWTVNVYQDIEAFYRGYRGEKRIIGKSAEGRDLFALFIGTHTRPVGIATYAMHAREWVTAYLAMQHVRRGLVTGGVWVVPLVNPDGALLVQEGARAAKQGERLCALCGGDFSLWKANARGVDLNVNWDARWGTGVQNVRFPSPANYIGPAPFSARSPSQAENLAPSLWFAKFLNVCLYIVKYLLPKRTVGARFSASEKIHVAALRTHLRHKLQVELSSPQVL